MLTHMLIYYRYELGKFVPSRTIVCYAEVREKAHYIFFLYHSQRIGQGIIYCIIFFSFQLNIMYIFRYLNGRHYKSIILP